MFRFVVSVLGWAGAFLRSRQDLALEILALRQPDLSLSGENVSDRFEVDNTPPAH